MAFKLRGTGTNQTKMYLQPVAAAAAPGSRQWEYVSADTPATVDGSAYISNATDDGDLALDMLSIGDLIWVYQVASISDSRPISDDKKSGITDVSLHVVLENTGALIDLSNDLFGGAGGTFAGVVTYGD